jgi:hypothetical protein
MTRVLINGQRFNLDRHFFIISLCLLLLLNLLLQKLFFFTSAMRDEQLRCRVNT